MKAKCKKCGDTVEVTRPREFKSCKCGAINLDYGDEFYYRIGGNPEDFDGEVEDVPKTHNTDITDIAIEHFHPEQTETIIRYNKSADDSMENAAGLRDPDNPSEAGVAEITMDTTNTRLVDTNLNNIATYLEELSDALEETSDLVSKISRLVMERSDKSEEFKNMMKGE